MLKDTTPFLILKTFTGSPSILTNTYHRMTHKCIPYIPFSLDSQASFILYFPLNKRIYHRYRALSVLERRKFHVESESITGQ
jgi:hypothetical protein